MKFSTSLFTTLGLIAYVSAQQVGTLTAETRPKLTWQKCSKGGTCQSQAASIVLDANWRWLHSTSGATNCYEGNTWDKTLCPDNVTCAKNCAVDGANYSGTYGISTTGTGVTHKFVQKDQYGTNVGSRSYLMDTTDSKYEMFMLKNKEFTFDVDVSKLACGLNGALYFVAMLADGGMSTEPNNKAGAKYGTGYCDAQCPHDIKFIKGEANAEGWAASSTDKNAGTGKYGTCCAEMDIWEANNISTAYTPHPCSSPEGAYRCSGAECGDGDQRYSSVCDKDGCDINPWRMGNKTFYGPGSSFTLNTNEKMTVVTQFITKDGTATGDLVEIRRKWIQNGKVYENAAVNIPGIPSVNSITDSYCDTAKTVFGDPNAHKEKGGLIKMGKAMEKGMVLVTSIWADFSVRMLWLDSDWPLDVPNTNLGVSRGSCATTSGEPQDLITNSPNAQVAFSNIRFGDLDSTYSGTPVNPGSSSSSTSVPTSTVVPTTTVKPTSTVPTTTVKPTTTVPAGGNIGKWQQCGGINWNGSGTCVSGSTCTKLNDYYSQCL
jgi:cellulose 1,4-beta-cellobiosidase